jgi:hypothetical protein
MQDQVIETNPYKARIVKMADADEKCRFCRDGQEDER